MPSATDMRRVERIAAGSIGVGGVVLALKAAAFALTGSAGLYSDALESVVNVATAVLAYAALRYASRPADASHPYGHGKAEFFAAVVEGVLVVLAALSILYEAWQAWLAPRHIDAPWKGLAIGSVATLLNAGWGLLLIRVGRGARSAALAADGRHLMADVVTSVGVVVGVGIVALTGAWRLDAVVAALTACHVLWSGIGMISESVGGLMDAAPSAPVVERIRALVAERAEGALEAHDLRTRRAGRLTYLEFHLVVPGELSVSDAHGICDRVEAGLRQEFEDLVVTIHVEPEAKAKHHGILVL